MTDRRTLHTRSRVRPVLAATGLLGALYVGVTDILALALPAPQALSFAPWNGAAGAKQAVTAAAASAAADGPGAVLLKRSAIRSLLREPLDYDLASVVAMAEYQQHRPAQARILFNLIGQQTPRELVTHIWLLTDAYTSGRSSDVIREAVIVMRQQPEMVDHIDTLLTLLVDNGQAVPDLIARLDDMPDWRSGFFDVFGERSANSDAAFGFLSAVARSAHPPRPSELRVWLLHEVARTDGDELVRRWKALQRPALSQSEALLRNPGFEGSAAPQPFDWTFFSPEGSFAEIGPSPTGGGKAMYVEMTGRSDASVASQMLDLTPGTYTLETSVYPISPTDRHDLKMTMSCAVGQRYPAVAQVPVVADQDRWSKIRWQFTLPANCHTQSLSIGMTPGSTTADLRVYFDDMTITPKVAAP